ncbi:MAG: hypothetical protein FRX49_09737 [Trebouxia sp. A1-2]|nr:MAG: hypothetical protein FRX49_09737 [Trebouxia sp. A1-2]
MVKDGAEQAEPASWHPPEPEYREVADQVAVTPEAISFAQLLKAPGRQLMGALADGRLEGLASWARASSPGPSPLGLGDPCRLSGLQRQQCLGLWGTCWARPLAQGKVGLGPEGALSQGGVMKQTAARPRQGHRIGSDGVYPLLHTQAIYLGAQARSMGGCKVLLTLTETSSASSHQQRASEDSGMRDRSEAVAGLLPSANSNRFLAP